MAHNPEGHKLATQTIANNSAYFGGETQRDSLRERLEVELVERGVTDAALVEFCIEQGIAQFDTEIKRQREVK
ncbi:MAG: hypothetical protein QG629_525 [Patescibacteria group bacterium]|nr:hypothetical protein [Candidatus Saccharibacteria bacterium]MDQ5963443.1 hypothetical protein [Patescibacteria group bacterium]